MEEPHFHIEVVVGVTDISMLVTLNGAAFVFIMLRGCVVPKLVEGAAHDLSGLRPGASQDVFGIEHPLLDTLDLRQGCRPADAFSHDGLPTRQLLGHQRAYGSPFFPSRSRLASTSSRSSPARTAGYSKGSVPSRFSAVSTPSA